MPNQQALKEAKEIEMYNHPVWRLEEVNSDYNHDSWKSERREGDEWLGTSPPLINRNNRNIVIDLVLAI